MHKSGQGEKIVTKYLISNTINYGNLFDTNTSLGTLGHQKEIRKKEGPLTSLLDSSS